MKIENITYLGRNAWKLDNDHLSLIMTAGGGHIASLTLDEKPQLNPLWVPHWKTMEPWKYQSKRHKKTHDSRLLASILGHNLCLGWFGDPSPEEARQGMTCHGEAPIARWKLIRKNISRNQASLVCNCRLPIAQMEVTRTITTQKGSNTLTVTEKVKSLSKRDLPFTLCEHVTLAPPFLEKDVTLFDLSATKGHTFPGPFGNPQRLRSDTDFVWPYGPGNKNKKVDLRTLSTRHGKHSDFSTQLMDPKKNDTWFSVINPKQGLLLAYLWKREDFPKIFSGRSGANSKDVC